MLNPTTDYHYDSDRGQHVIDFFEVFIARTPTGERVVCRVPPEDTATLARLLDAQTSPIGSAGQVSSAGEQPLVWRSV